MAQIEIHRLYKRYGQTPVVRGLSLSVASGELISLLGPSGCGKTTTLRVLAGLERADSGELSIGGERVDDGRTHVPPEKRNIGMVFQSYAVWPHRSVFQNVEYPLTLRKVAKNDRRERALEALRWVRLDKYADRMPNALSGGQLQRVALARALVANPRLMLLDEPLSNLDAALREEVRAEIAMLRARFGTTMIYVTHDQSEALALSDRIAVMNGGVLEQVDRPEKIYSDPQTAFVASFVGGSNLLEGDIRDGALHCGGYAFALPAGVDARPGFARIAVRAEDVAVGAQGALVPIAAKMFLGHATEYRFQIGETLLRAVGPLLPSGVGSSVGLRLLKGKRFD